MGCSGFKRVSEVLLGFTRFNWNISSFNAALNGF